LKIVVGGGVSSGNNSIVVAPNDTDATTCERENRSVGIENFSYDPNSDTFITTNHNIMQRIEAWQMSMEVWGLVALVLFLIF
jgi:hypothetical protein